MPIAPPDAAPRLDPVYVTDDDLEDLATFTGTPRADCLQRLKSYSTVEMADAWQRASPMSSADVLDFYAETDLYVWELMQWHASPARAPYWNALKELNERFPSAANPAALDFGCGVGTDALFLASKGYRVTLIDVDGPAFRFARHRFQRRGWDASFEVSRSVRPSPTGVFDVIVSFDVFEHLPEPVAAARALADHLRQGGVLAQNGEFSDDGHHPCHLRQGVETLGAGRWYAQLANLGFRGLGNMLFEKTSGSTRLMQRARYGVWRATGLWLEHVGK